MACADIAALNRELAARALVRDSVSDWLESQ
jgi:hypothetical protein